MSVQQFPKLEVGPSKKGSLSIYKILWGKTELKATEMDLIQQDMSMRSTLG